MADILFKKGSYGDFKSQILDQSNKVTPGALYLTEDEGGLYLGINSSTVKRIQGSIIFYKDALTFKGTVIDNPPYSRDVIYFIVSDNALIRWDDTSNKWIQINATADDVSTELTRLNNLINAEVTRATTAEEGLGERITANATAITTKLDTATFNTFKTNYDAKVTELEGSIATNASGVTAAKNAAAAAQTTANQGVTDAANALAEANKKAPIDHASTNTTYGLGTADKYGHLKLSDAVDSTKTTSDGTAATPKAVKTAYDKAVEAKSRADQGVTDAAAAQQSANQALTDAADAQDTADQAVQDAAAADAKAQRALDEKVDKTTYASDLSNTNSAIADAKQAGTTAQTQVSNLSSYVGSIPSGSTATSVIDYINAETAALENLVEAEETRAKGVESTLLTATQNASKAAAAAQATADQGVTAAAAAQSTANAAAARAEEMLPLDGSKTMTGSINMGGKSISNLADITSTSDGKMAANKNYVDAAVADGIAKSDAMTYKGTLGSTQALNNITTANKGDTYKISAAFTVGTEKYKVGDLVINSGADGAAPIWDHISSGYEDDYLQKLALEDTSGNIFLTDGVDNANNTRQGGFRIEASAASNLKFTVATDSDNIHVITATMEWGSFTS